VQKRTLKGAGQDLLLSFERAVLTLIPFTKLFNIALFLALANSLMTV
jgi:hypothetical protein